MSRPTETASERVARLLTLVPWLIARPGVRVEDAAAEFGITPRQLERDLALLFVCGTPGGLPGDLIEAEWESGRIYLGNADEISRPLRLALDEALTLIVGLRALADVPGVSDREVIDRVTAKLVAATSTQAGERASDAGRRIQVEVADARDAAHLAAVRGALEQHRRLHIAYVSPTRDEGTVRDVDPMRLLAQDGHWYLEGWCHRARDVRLFRLDRITDVEVLDEPGVPPSDARPRDLAAGMYEPAADDTPVVLDVEPAARWVADYYPHDRADETDEGGLRIHLRVADPAWLRRLVWRLGGQARIVEPADLARDVAQGARHALAAYGR